MELVPVLRNVIAKHP